MVGGDLHDRLAIDSVEDARRLRRCEQLSILDHEDVLARALTHESVIVEQDRFLIARLGGLDLGQHAVQVLPRGLGVGNQRVGRDPPPAGDLGANALGLALLAEIRAPRPRGDRHLNRSFERVQAHLAVATEHNGPDVALRELVGRDQLVGRGPQFFEREGDRHVVELGRLE